MKMQININPRLRFHLSPFVWVLLALMAIAFVVAMVRFGAGIGAISNLSNAYPWGFWVSFDLFTGIAISSGAFVLTSLVYILELEEFRPLVRPTLLTGFLGYVMEVIALLVDLGHPERIWHYFVYQNFTSFLLFIGLYVMIYATVMLVELAPAVLERFHLQKFADLIKRFMKPIVIIGATISVLHQGSLGDVATHPTRKTISTLVDISSASVVLHFCSGNCVSYDHFRSYQSARAISTADSYFIFWKSWRRQFHLSWVCI